MKINMGFLDFNLPFLAKQNLSIGLDIGSHAVKICEIATGGKGLRLISLGSALLPATAFVDGVLEDHDAVTRVIVALIKNLKLKSRKVAISVSGYSVIVKKINLPVMTEEDLEKYIQTEAAQYIPFNIEEVYLDFQNLKTNTNDETRTDVMLVAAKKNIVDGYLDMLHAVKLQPVIVDVDAFALENAYDINFGITDNVALVDIGAAKISINIIAHGTSVLVRDVVLGSRQLTEQIQSRFDLTFAEAEFLKLGKIQGEDKKQELARIFFDTCSQWISEIQRGLEFYKSNYSEEPVSKIILSGGGVKINGFSNLLAQETGIKVKLFNPFVKTKTDSSMIDPAYLQYIAPEMAIAVGLATRSVTT